MKIMVFTLSLFFTLNLKAITLDFKDLNNNPLNTTQLKDKTLLYFWATWCSECKSKLIHEIPELLKNKNLSTIVVSIDKNPRRVSHFVKKNDITVPILVLNSRDILKELDVNKVPLWIELQKEKTDWKITERFEGKLKKSY